MLSNLDRPGFWPAPSYEVGRDFLLELEPSISLRNRPRTSFGFSAARDLSTSDATGSEVALFCFDWSPDAETVLGNGTGLSSGGRPSLSRLLRPRKLGLRGWEARRGTITFEVGGVVRLSGLASLPNTESLGRRLGGVSRECLGRWEGFRGNWGKDSVLPFVLATMANFLGGVIDNGVECSGLLDGSLSGEREPGGKKSSGHLPFPSLMAGRARVRPSSPLDDFSLSLGLFAVLDPPPSVSSATRMRSMPTVPLGLRSRNPLVLESPPDRFLPLRYSSLSEGVIELASVRPKEGASEAKYDVASVVAVLVVPNLPPFAPPWLLTRLRLGSNRLEKVVVSLRVLDAKLCLVSSAKGRERCATKSLGGVDDRLSSTGEEEIAMEGEGI